MISNSNLRHMSGCRNTGALILLSLSARARARSPTDKIALKILCDVHLFICPILYDWFLIDTWGIVSIKRILSVTIVIFFFQLFKVFLFTYTGICELFCFATMADTTPGIRDYTKPAIDERIAELMKRRIAAREDLHMKSTTERLVSILTSPIFS